MNNYTDIDQRLHLLCQVIAKANRTFVPKQDDDSHTNLYFDMLGNRITGRWINAENKKLLLVLNLESLNIEIVNQSQTRLATILTVGSKIEKIEKEVEKQLLGLGLPSAGFIDALHFTIPDYSFKDEEVSALDAVSLNEWKHFRQLANEACAWLLGHAQLVEEIRIWPHHFDTGIYSLINSNLGLGFGLAMEDKMFGLPYFYMSGYPLNGTLNYDSVPSGNEWQWELGADWNGAILTIDKLVDKSDAAQKSVLIDYITTAYKWYANQ